MKNIRKRILACLLVLLCCVGTYGMISKASAAVYVSVSSGSVTVGNSVSVTINVSGGDISAYTLYVSYNSEVLTFNSGSGAIINGGGGNVYISGTGAGTVTLSFTASKVGTSGIYTSGEFYDINLNAITPSYGSASVTVKEAQQQTTQQQTTTEVDNRSGNCYLNNLEVGEGTLSPEFDNSVTSYELRVAEDTTYVAVTAYPADSKASVSIAGNNTIEPGVNTIKITVTAENGNYRIYSITVYAGEVLEDTKIDVDGVEYTIVNDEDEIADLEDLVVPEGFEATTVTFSKWDILAYKHSSGKLVIVCMKDENEKYGWFLYDEENQTFSKYSEISGSGNKYILLNIPEGTVVSSDYELTTVNINNCTVSAYTYKKLDSGYYIIYASNMNGDEGFYLYDSIEGNIIRYFIATDSDAVIEDTPSDVPDVTTPTDILGDDDGNTDNKLFTKNQFLIACIIVGSVFLILLILVIVFAVRSSVLKKRLEASLYGDTELIDDELYLDDEAADSVEDAGEENSEEDTEAEEVENEYTETDNTADAEETVSISEEAVEADDEAVADDITENADSIENSEEENTDTVVEENTDFTESVEEAKPKKKSSFEIFDAEESLESQLMSEERKQEYIDSAKEINEKIQSDYDAELDSAF